MKMGNRRLIKGICAGILGGIAATAVKTLWESKYPVRSEETDTPPVVLANKIKTSLGEMPVKKEDEAMVSDAIHWTFGTSVGAFYGGLAADTPVVANGLGLPFSLVFYALTHGSTIPMMGLEPYPVEVRIDYAWNEFAGHLLYGVTLDVVRRATLVVIE